MTQAVAKITVKAGAVPSLRRDLSLGLTLIKSAASADEPMNRYIEAHAAADGVDIGDDIFSDEALQQIADALLVESTVLWMHDISVPVGTIVDAKVVEDNGRKKVWVKVKLIYGVEVPIGPDGAAKLYDLWLLISQGHIRKMSVRYKVADGGEYLDTDGHRHITALEAVVEASFVSVGMNQGADVVNFYEAKWAKDTKTEMKRVGIEFGSAALGNLTEHAEGRMFSTLLDFKDIDEELVGVYAKSLAGKPIFRPGQQKPIGKVLTADVETGHVILVGVVSPDEIGKTEMKRVSVNTIAEKTAEGVIARLSDSIITFTEKKDAGTEADATDEIKAEATKAATESLAAQINEKLAALKAAEGDAKKPLRAEVADLYEQFVSVTGTSPAHPLSAGFEGTFPPVVEVPPVAAETPPDVPAVAAATETAPVAVEAPAIVTPEVPVVTPPVEEEKSAAAALATKTEKKSMGDYYMASAWSLVESVDCFAEYAEVDQPTKDAFAAAADMMRTALGKPSAMLEEKSAKRALARTETKAAGKQPVSDPSAALKALEAKAASAIAQAEAAAKSATASAAAINARAGKLEGEVKSALLRAVSAEKEAAKASLAAATNKAALLTYQKRIEAYDAKTPGPQGGGTPPPAPEPHMPFAHSKILPALWDREQA